MSNVVQCRQKHADILCYVMCVDTEQIVLSVLFTVDWVTIFYYECPWWARLWFKSAAAVIIFWLVKMLKLRSLSFSLTTQLGSDCINKWSSKYCLNMWQQFLCSCFSTALQRIMFRFFLLCFCSSRLVSSRTQMQGWAVWIKLNLRVLLGFIDQAINPWNTLTLTHSLTIKIKHKITYQEKNQTLWKVKIKITSPSEGKLTNPTSWEGEDPISLPWLIQKTQNWKYYSSMSSINTTLKQK